MLKISRQEVGAKDVQIDTYSHNEIILFNHIYSNNVERVSLIVYFPGRWQNCDLYPEQIEDDFRYLLAEYGHETVTIQYRSAGQNTSVPKDNWSTLDFLYDMNNLKGIITHLAQGKPIILSGFSMGAGLALLSTKIFHSAQGVILLDGGLASPYFELPKYPKQEFLENPAWNHRFRALAQYALKERDLTRFINEIENINVLRMLYMGNRWWPIRQLHQMYSLSQLQIVDTLNPKEILNGIDCNILCFVATGFINQIHRSTYSASLTSANSIETHVLESFSHLGVLVGDYARKLVHSPMLDWIQRQT